MTNILSTGIVRAAIRLAALSICLGLPITSFADNYEDQCVLSASRLLPMQAQISTTKTSSAPASIVSQHNRDLSLHWIVVDFSIGVGNREIVRRYLCAQNVNGDFYAFAPDNDPLQSTFDWARIHNIP